MRPGTVLKSKRARFWKINLVAFINPGSGHGKLSLA